MENVRRIFLGDALPFSRFWTFAHAKSGDRRVGRGELLAGEMGGGGSRAVGGGWLVGSRGARGSVDASDFAVAVLAHLVVAREGGLAGCGRRRQLLSALLSALLVGAQGEDGDYYYILDSGHTEVWLSKPPGTPEVKVFEYSVGGAFGELALLHGEPRQATVRATAVDISASLSWPNVLRTCQP